MKSFTSRSLLPFSQGPLPSLWPWLLSLNSELLPLRFPREDTACVLREGLWLCWVGQGWDNITFWVSTVPLSSRPSPQPQLHSSRTPSSRAFPMFYCGINQWISYFSTFLTSPVILTSLPIIIPFSFFPLYVDGFHSFWPFFFEFWGVSGHKATSTHHVQLKWTAHRFLPNLEVMRSWRQLATGRQDGRVWVWPYHTQAR